MSSTERQRNVLVCALCRKEYFDPRHLLCLHTFCRNCIKTNAGRVLKEKSKAYPCPLCQRNTPISDKGDKWIDELPVNDLILDITNALKLQKGEVNCVPCSRKGKSAQATDWCNACREAMCEECKGVHNTLQSTMKHDTVNISRFRKRSLQEVVSTPFCAEHDWEKLTMFCKDHDKAICTSCAANGHRACKQVSSIDEITKERKGLYRDLKGTLEKQTINANLLVEDRKDAFSFFDNASLNTRGKIESVRRKINDVLIKCEKKALKDLDDVCEKEKSYYQSQISHVENLAEESGNALALLDTAVEDGSDVNRIQWLNKFDDESSRIAQDIQLMDAKIPRTSLDFKIQKQLEEVLKSVDTLGELVMAKEGKASENKFVKPTQNKPTMKVNRTLALATPAPRQADQSFSARTLSDEEPCLITGIANLSSNLWVLADKSNSKLKVYTDEFRLKSEYFMEQAPFDVTVIDQGQVGVSIPMQYKIQIYDVKTGIDPVKSVKIKAHCYGISFANNVFVVACPMSAPPCVRIVSLDGQEMTQISPGDSVIPLFLRPWYVKHYSNGVDFAVSDANRNHVSCLNRAVFRHFKYVNFNLTGPRGVTLTKNDDLYVCGWGSDNVQKIDGKGKYLEEILTRHNGIISPQNICVSASQKLLLVTLDPTSGNSDNILVFKL